MAKARGFAPECVLFDGWYASLENLKQVRDFGWIWLTRLKGNRKVTPDDRNKRALDEVALGGSGTRFICRVMGWSESSGSTPQTASRNIGRPTT